MYCNHCGVQVASDARFCPNCKAELRGVQVVSRVKQQLTLLSSLWFAMGALRLVLAVGMFVFASVFLPLIARQEREPIPFPVPALMTGFGVLLAVFAALTLLAGWGLYRRERWGRTLALVMAFLNLLSVPFGTALGIYTLVVLLPTESEAEWRAISQEN